jgi:hypothetical protein
MTALPRTNAAKALSQLIQKPAEIRMTEAARIIAGNRRLIRKAMRMGHGLEAISRELSIPKSTLQRHLNSMGLFFRKPRKKKGEVIRPNSGAISRAKTAALAKI